MKKAKQITSDDIIFISLSAQDEPSFRVVKNREYVLWGENNLFCNMIADTINKSSLHNTILQGKVRLTQGNGFYITNVDELEPFQQTTINSFLNQISDEDTINEILRKVSNDLQLYGGFCLEIIYSKDKSKIARVNHIDLSKIRCGKYSNGKIEDYYYSFDWKNLRENPYEIIPAFNTNKPGGRQLLFVKNYVSNQDYYPRESFRGALNFIDIAYRIGNYHRNLLKNGMTPTVVVSFSGAEPTKEERDIIYKRIKALYTGDDNSGKFILTFGDKDSKPTIQTISPTDSDKQFIMLNTLVTENILLGHSANGILFGQAVAGKLGTRNEIRDANEQFYNMVITSDQQLIEGAFQKILKYNKLDFAKLQIKRTDVLSAQLSDAIIQTITSINELRKIIDYPAIDKDFANRLPNEPKEVTPPNDQSAPPDNNIQ